MDRYCDTGCISGCISTSPTGEEPRSDGRCGEVSYKISSKDNYNDQSRTSGVLSVIPKDLTEDAVRNMGRSH